MSPDIDLQAIEKKAWMSTWDDGLFDIMMGTVLVIISIMPVVRELIGYWYIPIIIIVPGVFSASLMYFGKKTITEPRTGVAKFGAERMSKQKKSLKLSILSTAILIMLVLMTAFGLFNKLFGISLSGIKVPLTIAVAVALLLSFKARILAVPRLEIYGIVIGAGVLSVEFLRPGLGDPWHYMVSFGVPGLVILAYGLRRLFGFMRKYPVPVGGGM